MDGEDTIQNVFDDVVSSIPALAAVVESALSDTAPAVGAPPEPTPALDAPRLESAGTQNAAMFADASDCSAPPKQDVATCEITGWSKPDEELNENDDDPDLQVIEGADTDAAGCTVEQSPRPPTGGEVPADTRYGTGRRCARRPRAPQMRLLTYVGDSTMSPDTAQPARPVSRFGAYQYTPQPYTAFHPASGVSDPLLEQERNPVLCGLRRRGYRNSPLQYAYEENRYENDLVSHIQAVAMRRSAAAAAVLGDASDPRVVRKERKLAPKMASATGAAARKRDRRAPDGSSGQARSRDRHAVRNFGNSVSASSSGDAVGGTGDDDGKDADFVVSRKSAERSRARLRPRPQRPQKRRQDISESSMSESESESESESGNMSRCDSDSDSDKEYVGESSRAVARSTGGPARTTAPPVDADASLAATLQAQEGGRPRRRAALGRIRYTIDNDPSDVDEQEMSSAASAASTDEDDGAEHIEQVLTHIRRRALHVDDLDSGSAILNSVAQVFEADDSYPDDDTMYLVKWRGRAHIYNTWESEADLRSKNVKGLKKLDNYIKDAVQAYSWRENEAWPEEIEQAYCVRAQGIEALRQYMELERIIAVRQVAPPTVSDASADAAQPDASLSAAGAPETQYLCKWAALPYAACTWEPAGVVGKQWQAQIDAFLERECSTLTPDPHCEGLRRRPPFYTITAQPAYLGGADVCGTASALLPPPDATASTGPSAPALESAPPSRSAAAGSTVYELRDYQLHALNWLVRAWCDNRSSILADEMGLGKTIEAISFLAYLHHSLQVHGPFLICAPLSAIDDWQRGFGVWEPKMNVVLYIGDRESRRLTREYEFYLPHQPGRIKFNVLITTYEFAQADKDELRSIPWASLTVDEAHRLKNPDSKLYRILSEFRSHHRLLITGTPVQNSLHELWSLLNFLAPGHFGRTSEEFVAHYKARLLDHSGIVELHALLKPYLLRRVKKDVEKSLPPKLERILRVEMSALQKQYYQLILSRNHEALRRGSKKAAVSSLINVVMELKKCTPIRATAARPGTRARTP